MIVSFAPSGLGDICLRTHGLRRGLHSFAASRLESRDEPVTRACEECRKQIPHPKNGLEMTKQ
jgi:hypothetical protein